MKVSFQWLNDYVNISDFFSNPEKLLSLLTHAGFEVEEFKDFSKMYKNIFVGEVLECLKHPQADRLRLCKVGLGRKAYSVVCGAFNFKEGDKVVFALPGATLWNPVSQFEYKIQTLKIRGVESEGMICSKSELRLNEKALEKVFKVEKDENKEESGIFVLPQEALPGEDFSQFFKVNDILFDLNVTPNRSDCLSHKGMAREIACILKRSFNESSFFLNQKLSHKKSEVYNKNKSKDQNKKKHLFHVNVKAQDLCPLYTGKVLKNIKITSSPEWFARRLELLGLSSHNNVVDVTNYVMLEWGQPLHAFDFDRLNGGSIILDKASSGESFLALDGRKIELTGEELTVRDEKGPIALAGVIGGEDSSVKESTQNLFLESAYFSPLSVRKTSRFFGLVTDSALRFSRGVDFHLVEKSLHYAVHLIQSFSDNQSVGQSSDEERESLNFFESFYKVQSSYRMKRAKILISKEDLDERLGYSPPKKKFLFWMKSLNCEVEERGSFSVTPPSYRLDLKREVDLIEEFSRLEGYKKIPEIFPAFKHRPLSHDLSFTSENRITQFLIREGYLQAFNYCFIGEDYQNKILGLKERVNERDMNQNSTNKEETNKEAFHFKSHFNFSSPSIFIKNPLSEDLNVMRKSLLPGLLKNCVYNYHHGRIFGRIFEIGYSFVHLNKTLSKNKLFQSEVSKGQPSHQKNKFSHGDYKYEERKFLSLIVWGEKEGLWKSSLKIPLVFELKRVVENLMSFLVGESIWKWRSFDKGEGFHFLHPGQSAELSYKGESFCYLGTLHPSLKKEYKFRSDVALFEMNLEKNIKSFGLFKKKV